MTNWLTMIDQSRAYNCNLKTYLVYLFTTGYRSQYTIYFRLLWCQIHTIIQYYYFMVLLLKTKKKYTNLLVYLQNVALLYIINN